MHKFSLCTISVYGHSSGSEDLGSIQDLWACVPKVLFMLLQSALQQTLLDQLPQFPSAIDICAFAALQSSDTTLN